MSKTLEKVEIRWDIGTSYDLFVSLAFLHDPEPYGLRSSWAAGVRQRLPQKERDILAAFVKHIAPLAPANWLRDLPSPKNAQQVINTFSALSPLDQVMSFVEFTPPLRTRIIKIVEQHSWDETDMDTLVTYYKDIAGITRPRKLLTAYLDGLAQGLDVIVGVPAALQTYYEIFFEEEEHRITPYLEAGLTHAQQRLTEIGLLEWISEYSRGAKLDESYFEPTKRLTLIPSFWISPFILRDFINDGLILFGVRPDTVPLIPGELVPDSILNMLNALANPTRLKILRYVSNEELTATQIAARLRLRTPTVAHHLKSLRLAGLIYISSRPNQKELYYKTRTERLLGVSDLLTGFVNGEDPHEKNA